MEARLKYRAFRERIVTILAITCLSVGVSGQSAGPQKKAQGAPSKAEITRFFIGNPIEDSGYETGPLHVVYDDGTEIVETLPPLEASTEKETVFNDVGFADVQLAEDRQTLGWTINVENCCTSYSIPLSVVVFRDKKVLHTISPGLMIWSWKFVDGGKKVEVVSGTVHGSDVGDDQVYDVQSGKLLSDDNGGGNTQAPKPVPAKVPDTPGDDLIRAAQKGDLPRVLALLRAHVDVNSNLNGNLDGGTTALIEASKAGHLDVVKVLIAAHADVNAKDGVSRETALIYASAGGQLDIVQALLAAHADANARGIYGNPSALFAASNVAVVKALIAADADVNYRSTMGVSALMGASSEGRLDVVRALIAAQADVSAKGDNGDTALIDAAGHGHVDVVQFLLENGANPTDMTDYGDTPLKAAAALITWT